MMHIHTAKIRKIVLIFIYNGSHEKGRVCMKNTPQDIIDLYHDDSSGLLRNETRGDIGIIRPRHMDLLIMVNV